MQFKRFYFDVELIIDHYTELEPYKVNLISNHKIYRGLSETELMDLINSNKTLEDSNIKVTLNIRGVNY